MGNLFGRQSQKSQQYVLASSQRQQPEQYVLASSQIEYPHPRQSMQVIEVVPRKKVSKRKSANKVLVESSYDPNRQYSISQSARAQMSFSPIPTQSARMLPLVTPPHYDTMDIFANPSRLRSKTPQYSGVREALKQEGRVAKMAKLFQN